MINKIWLEEFGDNYHDRNVLTDEQTKNRVAFFAQIFNMTSEMGKKPYLKSIIEVGAGSGNNVKVISKIISDNGLNCKLGAIEPNEKARTELSKIEGLSVFGTPVPFTDIDLGQYDLAFTSGLLIHIPPNDLIAAMRNIYKLSSKYILCMEYFSPVERMISYRGQEEALWTRDYGSIWKDNFPLTCLGFGFLWKPVTSFDNITWWLFEKVN